MSVSDVEVVITGEPNRVRHLFRLVKKAMDKERRRNRRQLRFNTGSGILQPSDLDDRDAPSGEAPPPIVDFEFDEDTENTPEPRHSATLEIPGRRRRAYRRKERARDALLFEDEQTQD